MDDRVDRNSILTPGDHARSRFRPDSHRPLALHIPSPPSYRGSPVPVTRPAAAASSSATGGGAGHEHDRSEAGSVGDGTAPAVLQRATAGPAARAPPAPIAGPDKLISEGHHDGRSCQTDAKGAKRRLTAAVDRDREAGHPEAHRRWGIRRSRRPTLSLLPAPSARSARLA